MMKRLVSILAIFVCLWIVAPVGFAAGKDNWVSVRSKNFFLVGNASEKEIRQVAVKLEQFREAFGRLLPTVKFSSPVPTTVIVFKSDDAYRPYKPVVDNKISNEVAGYFQPGEDVNYITLSIEKRSEQTFRTIFHEYIHMLVNNTQANLETPVWFDEGLAEYYSTVEIKDNQKVILGHLIFEHLEVLRANELWPLKMLFTADRYALHRQSLLRSIKTAEERMAVNAKENSADTDRGAPPALKKEENISQEERMHAWLQERLRKPVEGEQRIQGLLVNIECVPKNIVYTIKLGDRLLKLRSDSFNNVDMVAHTDEVKHEVSCGPRKPESLVVIIYRPTADARRKIDGEAISFEFVPVKFQLKQ